MTQSSADTDGCAWNARVVEGTAAHGWLTGPITELAEHARRLAMAVPVENEQVAAELAAVAELPVAAKVPCPGRDSAAAHPHAPFHLMVAERLPEGLAEGWWTVERAAEDRDPDTEFSASCKQLYVDRYPEALRELTQALRLAEQHESVFTVASLIGRLTHTHARWGNGERAVGLGRQALGLARDAELYCAPLLADLALAESVGGTWGHALELAEAGVAEAEVVRDGAYQADDHHLVGMVLLFKGDAAAALPAMCWTRKPFAGADPAVVSCGVGLVKALLTTAKVRSCEVDNRKAPTSHAAVGMTLGRVYRKTGVRSRVELVRRLSAPVRVGG